MSKAGLTNDDFIRIKTIMQLNPKQNEETQKDYFARLKENHPLAILPSRATLNIIFRSENYEKFCKIRSGYNGRAKEKHIETESTDKEVVSVKAVCPQEDIASQCDECPEEPEETQANPEDFTECEPSALTAKDKKDLAMYAIDQYYFFLKQLTGVI